MFINYEELYCNCCLHLPTTPFVTSDLALRNCLLSANVSVKIGDYGLSHTKYKVCLSEKKNMHTVKYVNIKRIILQVKYGISPEYLAKLEKEMNTVT